MGEQVEDPADHSGVSGAGTAMPVEQTRHWVEEERKQHAVRLGNLQRALKGTRGGLRVAKRVPGYRLQQESLNQSGTVIPHWE